MQDHYIEATVVQVEKPLSHCFEKWTVDNCGFLRNPAPPLDGWNMLKHVETHGFLLPHPSTGVEFGNHPRYRIHKL